MGKDSLSLLHLYPDRMNIYGDFGNIIALRYHLGQNDIDFDYYTHEVGEKLTKSYDMVFMGGGQDSGQLMVAGDLQKHKQYLFDHFVAQKPILTICGGYQLFGHAFYTFDKQEIKGIGIFDAVTKATSTRMIGNIVVDSPRLGRLIGFENHSGATHLLNDNSPLGKVVKGYGNNLERAAEGIMVKKAIGTYMHGSFLPKNPKAVKYLVDSALKHKLLTKRLSIQNDKLENQTRDWISQNR